MADLRSRVEQSLTGQYTLERELGGGGMSRVFVATEDRLGRQVVVKVLSTELAASLSVPRFEREIRLAASLQQANIVPVLTAGDIEGIPYYTMPFVEGESLRARLGRGPLSFAEVMSILRDVARALAYAHERGVVHRDIKPDNVLLSGHTAVVTDFGIAKAIAAASESPAGATLTQLGTAVGTPAYMAPEQAAGDPSTDHRADIYAFGCLAYELLAGRQPFPDLPPHKLLIAHMSETPRPVTEFRPDTPGALAALVMQCLAKEPGQRPASATELLRRLDAVVSPSGASAAVPGILIGNRPMLGRALGIYAVAFAAVAILARAAILAIGLPDWVFPGALIVMALGLPVVLLTAWSQYVSRRAATATPTFTPGGTRSLAMGQGTMATLAIKASPHLSWRRTARGGIFALGAFVLLIAGYMLLRVLGIGPEGSLLAAGKLSASDKILVAAFDAPGADSSLGSTIAEAVRTNLSESRALHLVPTSTVVATLEQMQRPDTTRIDLATAREIAQRSGAKAVVAGSIVPLGAGYVVTARLVAAESGNELASYSASAKDAGELIGTVDELTKKLRGRIGESLKAVRDAPRLDQVTTASLGALRSYAAGLHANDVVGDYPAAVQHFRDAIQQDSTFAMAYVQLSYSLLALGTRAGTAQADTALRTAFRLRDRLPERERYNVEGAYYGQSVGDRRQAITALERAVALDSTNIDAANNLAIAYEDVRRYPESERAYRIALASDPTNGTLLTNLAGHFTRTGDHRAFDSVMAVLARDSIPFPTGPTRFAEYWSRANFDAAEQQARAGIDSAPPRARVGALDGLSYIDVLRGKLRDAEKVRSQQIDARMRFRADTTSPYQVAQFQAMVDGILRGNTRRGIAELDSTYRAHPPGSLPETQQVSYLVAFGLAQLGEPARAREVMRTFEERLDTARARQLWVPLARTHSLIALAEGKADSAVYWARRGDNEADGLPTSNCPNCTNLLLGLAYDRGRQTDSARKYLAAYASAPSAYTIDSWFLPSTLLRLGELSREAGDTTAAIDAYRRFIDLWKNADPELQPRVTEAKKQLNELLKAKG